MIASQVTGLKETWRGVAVRIRVEGSGDLLGSDKRQKLVKTRGLKLKKIFQMPKSRYRSSGGRHRGCSWEFWRYL